MRRRDKRRRLQGDEVETHVREHRGSGEDRTDAVGAIRKGVG